MITPSPMGPKLEGYLANLTHKYHNPYQDEWGGENKRMWNEGWEEARMGRLAWIEGRWQADRPLTPSQEMALEINSRVGDYVKGGEEMGITKQAFRGLINRANINLNRQT